MTASSSSTATPPPSAHDDPQGSAQSTQPQQSQQQQQQSTRPPVRPNLRSDFDLEPNPFEQSFSYSSTSLKSASTSGSNNNNSTHSPRPRAASDAGPEHPSKPSEANRLNKSSSPDPPKAVVLPPLAALASPSGPSDFSWSFSSADLTSSLRSGPLSPAMLQRPRDNNSTATPGTNHHLMQTSHSLHHGLHHPAFDANFRTGLTPGTGLTPLIGGPASFPPPSPNTAAFLAMVTNQSSANAAANSIAATITPNTLNAITGALGTMPNTAANNNTNGNPHPLSMSHVPATNGSYNQSQPPPNQSQSPAYSNTAQNAQNAATAAANGLFLLSQAHQELTKMEEAQQQLAKNSVAAATANASTNGRRPAKRKSEDVGRGGPSTASNAKKTRGNTRSTKRKKTDEMSPDLDEMLEPDSDEDEDSDTALGPPGGSASPTARGPMRRGSTSAPNASKKFETEEEKRKNFLERNRQAALKCRQRKKAWLSELQAKVEYLTVENEQLQSTILSMREEISRLTAVVVAQGGVVVPGVGASMGNGSVNIPGGGHGHGGQGGHSGKSGANGRGRDEGAPVSVSVNLPSANVVAHAPSGNGGHYGY